MNVTLAAGYNPHPAQVKLHTSGARFLLAAAGVRGGKSKSAAAEVLFRIYRDLAAGKARPVSGTGRNRSPALRYWVVAPTAALCREPMRMIREFVPNELVERQYENQLWLRPNILIEAKSADNPHTLVAVGLDGLLVDEAARVQVDAWQGQLRQRLSDRQGWAIFATTPLGRNWVYSDLVAKGLNPAFDDYEVVTWRTIDNPAIPAGEVDRARAELPPRYFQREYEASFDSFSGNVFEEFNETLHVFETQPDPATFRSALIAMDFGWSSPGCALVIADYGHRFEVVEEVYRSNYLFHDARLETGTWLAEVKRMRERWRPPGGAYPRVVCDPAEPDKINELVRNGLNASPAPNEIVSGIRRMATALHPVEGRPRLRIWKGCTNLLREIRTYVWDTAKDGSFTEMPAPNQSDHAIDACRYGMATLMPYAKTERAPEAEPERIGARPAVSHHARQRERRRLVPIG